MSSACGLDIVSNSKLLNLIVCLEDKSIGWEKTSTDTLNTIEDNLCSWAKMEVAKFDILSEWANQCG